MATSSKKAYRFVQTAPINRSPGYEISDGVMVFLADADLRACGIDTENSDYIGVRITPERRIELYEASGPDDERP